MSGISTQNTNYLTRTQLWDPTLKEVFQEDLMGWKYIDMLTGFTDGDTLNIPSIGEMEVQDYAEGQAVRYTGLDTGNYQFQLTDYVSAGTYVYDKWRQDSYYTDRVVSSFVPKMNRALQERMETDAMALAPDNQTLNDPNLYNTGVHRFVASGTNETVVPEDFAKARYALRKANVPMVGLTAIVDPSVTHNLQTMTNLVNFMSPVPGWNTLINDGAVTGMKFRFNLFGFDVYESDFLKKNTASETINDGSGNRTSAAGVNNIFFSAGAKPFIGAIRQAPKVEYERNKDFQRDEWVVTARYGLDVFRPEAVVCVVSDMDQVYVA
jgi:hypothetical protein